MFSINIYVLKRISAIGKLRYPFVLLCMSVLLIAQISPLYTPEERTPSPVLVKHAYYTYPAESWLHNGMLQNFPL